MINMKNFSGNTSGIPKEYLEQVMKENSVKTEQKKDKKEPQDTEKKIIERLDMQYKMYNDLSDKYASLEKRLNRYKILAYISAAISLICIAILTVA